jgi:glycosyltransferase involved in cell wall biosynthesis
LRILFLAYRDFKNPSAVGGDIYLWELAKGLSNAGHEVAFICSRFKGSREIEKVEGVRIIRVKSLFSLALGIFNEYFKRFRGQFDVIVEEVIGGQRLPFLATLYVKEPLIAVWHQKHDKIFREQYPFPIALILSLFERLLARLYRDRVIITPSKGSKQKLFELGFRNAQIKVVYDGVGEMFVDAKMNEKRENIIVCLGKLRRYKRFDHAILALKHMRDLGIQDYKLVIAGKVSEIDRGYINELKKLAERLRVSDHIEFKLNITEKEKLQLLQKARILVQPSPVEGFSIVVAEANRCGTPVVASDGVPNDVVRNGFNGFVYAFGNIEALVIAITKLIKDEKLWRSLSKNAYDWAKQFAWDRSVSIFVNILKHVRVRKAVCASIKKAL